ncbi:MAG: tetraacyldisaccharide 4'-kinase [Bacteroidales bacterium]|nr:tetraacyldisaccharide 4'-kinase [Bacteroidales bacterium]
MQKWIKYSVVILLFPFTFLYWLVIKIRHFLYDTGIFKSISFPIPVICVGNITVGGTGKTPHIEYLIRLLKDEFKIAVLSRGYKRKTSNYIRATTKSTSEEIGDEPRQIKQKFPEIEVAVETDRVYGVKQLINDVNGLNLVLLDDAFQHRSIKPGLNILLIDYNRPILQDFILPSGRLRDCVNQRKRAEIIIISKCPVDLKEDEKKKWEDKYLTHTNQRIFFTSMAYEGLNPMFSSQKALTFQDIKQQKISVLLFTGIANPKSLRNKLMDYATQVSLLEFPDHHTFTHTDIQKLYNRYNALKSLGKIIVTTEKDAARLLSLIKDINQLDLPIYIAPISVEFLLNEAQSFKNLVRSYC